ncbi:MAG: type I secretion system permease/ATPase [Steroidobacteraceae bacterium]
MEESKEEPRAGTRADARGGFDSGLVALALVARFHGVAADPATLRRHFGLAGGERFDVALLLRAARQLELKARRVERDPAGLAETPLPALAECCGGGFVVLAGVSEDRVLLQDPALATPEVTTRAGFATRCTGRLILVTRRAAPLTAVGGFDLSWFLRVVLRYRRLLLEVLAASLFLQLLALVTPLLFQVVIDKLLVHDARATLDVLAIGLALVALFEALLGGLRSWLFSDTAMRIDVLLGAQLYRHLLSLPLTFFQSRPAGTVVTRMRELERIREFLTGPALALVLDSLFGVVFLAIMYAYSATLLCVVLATLPAYVLLSLVVTPVLQRRLDEKFQRGAENQAFLTESVVAIETVKALAAAPQMQRRFEEQLAAYVTASLRVVSLGNLAGQTAGLLNRLSTVLLLWMGARLVLGHELSVGELVAFNLFAGRVNAPILRLAQMWQDFQQARVSVERLGDVFNMPAEPGISAGRTSLPPLAGAVGFHAVTFRYAPGRSEALRGVSLDVAPGEIVGIVGRSGSGKSTIARLIQRLYVPEAGQIRLDGVDIAAVDPAALRRQIGVVLQETMLVNRPIRDNIALADPGMPLEPIMRAAALAGAHEFIVGLPQGYDTQVAEYGANLSDGQRQRIAIARALVTDPRILILDGATSALDHESERIIQRNLRLICRGRTVFIIAHRLEVVRAADRILVMDGGAIVEQGTYEEMLAGRGRYAALCG